MVGEGASRFPRGFRGAEVTPLVIVCMPPGILAVGLTVAMAMVCRNSLGGEENGGRADGGLEN